MSKNTKPLLTVSLPCDGCTLCCQNEALFLHEEYGDDPQTYECERAINPITQLPTWQLRNQANGDCIYLVRGKGCSIHDRRPALCRTFDCRQFFVDFMRRARPERRRWQRQGFASKELLAQGQAMLEQKP